MCYIFCVVYGVFFVRIFLYIYNGENKGICEIASMCVCGVVGGVYSRAFESLMGLCV